MRFVSSNCQVSWARPDPDILQQMAKKNLLKIVGEMAILFEWPWIFSGLQGKNPVHVHRSVLSLDFIWSESLLVYKKLVEIAVFYLHVIE
jgi:hypothetical protein